MQESLMANGTAKAPRRTISSVREMIPVQPAPTIAGSR